MAEKAFLVLAEAPSLHDRYGPTVEPVEVLGEKGHRVRIRRFRGEASWEEEVSSKVLLREEEVAEALFPVVPPDDPLVGLPSLLALHLQGALDLEPGEIRRRDPEELLRAYLVALRHPEVVVSLKSAEALGIAALGFPYAFILRELAGAGRACVLAPQAQEGGAAGYGVWRLELGPEGVRPRLEGFLGLEALLEEEPDLDLKRGGFSRRGVLLGREAAGIRPSFAEAVEGKDLEALADLLLRLRQAEG